MGTRYTTQTAVGYNATPPPDDGSVTENNRTTWAKHKDKLADPIKVLADAINAAILAHTDESVLDTAIARTTIVGDHKRTINVTAGVTQSLGDATSLGSGYVVIFKNSHTAPITIDLATATDTLDGVVDGSYLLEANSSVVFITTTGADGFEVIGAFDHPSKAADIASAATLPFGSKGFADVTGTVTITALETSGVVGTSITRQFDAALTLTHNATDLILPSGANIITAAGDIAKFTEYASGDWICTNYQRATGRPLIAQARVLIESQTASASGSLDFTTGIDSTYDHYEFVLINVLPATDGTFLRMRTSNDGGSTYDSDALDYISEGNNNHLKVCYSRHGTLEFDIANVAAQGGVSGVVHVYSPADTVSHTAISSSGVCSRDTGNAPVSFDTAGSGQFTPIVSDAIQFFFSSGNIASGEIRLYGIP